MVLVLLPMLATADTEMVNGVKWTYYIEDGKAVVCNRTQDSYSSELYQYYDYKCAIPAEITGKVSVPSVLGGCAVVGIGPYAFEGCASVTEFEFPSTLTNIEHFAFCDCRSLKEIILPDYIQTEGHGLFQNCYSLEQVRLPSHLTQCGNQMFFCCNSLTNLVIPASVTNLGSNVFANMRALEEIQLPAGVTHLPSYAFSGCWNLKAINLENVTHIDYRAFEHCDSLNVRIHDGVVHIGWEAMPTHLYDTTSHPGFTFVNGWLVEYTGMARDVVVPSCCRGVVGRAFFQNATLETIILPDGCKSVGEEAFYQCVALKGVELPDNVVFIGENCFYGCTALGFVVLPSRGVECGGWGGAFGMCTSLSNLTYAGNVSLSELGIGAWNFSALEEVVVSEGAVEIADWAFGDFKGIRKVSLPTTLKKIGAHAFDGCADLVSVIIPVGSSLEQIGDYAFAHCGNLTSVSIPESVTDIGSGAFFETPFMQVEGDKREIAYVGNWALGFKTCLVSSTEQITFEDFYGDYEHARTVDVVLKEGTEHIANDAFYSIRFKIKGSDSDWGSEYTIPYGKISLPDGLRTIGAGAFSSTYYPGGHRDEDLIVPESVVWIGECSLSGIIDRRICFRGVCPQTGDDPFSQRYYYGGEDISTVYYVSGTDGWQFDGLWQGVRTYPWTWSEKRVSKVKLGPVYEFDRDPGEYWLVHKDEVEDDEYFAIPVTGAADASDINPVVLHHNSSTADIASIEIWTDTQMFDAVLKPLLPLKSKWRTQSEYYCDYYYCESTETAKWPVDMWPEDNVVSSRFWIVAKPNAGTWYGMRDFRIGLFGTDEVTERIYLANDSTYAPAASDKACLDTKRVAYAGRSAPHMGYGKTFCPGVVRSWGDCLGGTMFKTEGVRPASFTATVKEPGLLVLSVADSDYIWDEGTQTGHYIGENFKSQMTVSGGRIVADTEESLDERLDAAYSWDDYPNYEVYDGDYDAYNRDCVEWEYRRQAVLDAAYTNLYWRYGGGGCIRRITVGEAGTYTFASKSQGDICANRFHFFPRNRDSVAIDAIFMEAEKCNSCSHDIANGYVLGSGVYVAGETATFTAVPAPGERFDHWEAAFGELPKGLDLKSPTLSFVVTSDMCGAMEEERQIVIRAVWKKKNRPEIIPSPVGAATIDGNISLFEGEESHVTLAPSAGCVFVRWIDSSRTMLSRTFSFAEAMSEEPYRAIFTETPVDQGPQIVVDDLADSYAVGMEIAPISVGVSGSGYAVAISELPTGLMFANGCIVGAPTKTGSFAVTVTANKSGAQKLVRTFNINVTFEFLYEETDGGIIITGTPIASLTGELVIPSTYDGKPVKQVGVGGWGHETRCFADCGITSLVISDGVEELSYGAFRGCANLASVTLPSTLKIIRGSCFEACSSLGSIVLPEGLQKVGFDFLYGTAVSTLNIPSTLVDIEEGALAISSGRKFTVAEGNPRYRVENGYIYDFVNNVVFMRADYYQKTFVISDGAECIADCCFGDCDGGNITIPASVWRIDYGAFCECQGLTVTFLGAKPEVWGGDIFSDSTNVRTYVQPGQGWDDVVRQGAWQGVPIAYVPGTVFYETRENVDGSVTLVAASGDPSGALTIPAEIEGCAVTEIGDNAFGDYLNLVDVVFPQTLKRIGFEAFCGCANLSSVTIPTSVTNIGAEAFWGCPNLTTVYVSSGDAKRVAALYEFGSDVRFVELVSVHTVTFDANGGECAVPSKVVNDGEAVGELPEATLAGHTFDGWFTEDGTQVSANTIVNGDVTYFAHWVPVIEPSVRPDWKGVIKEDTMVVYAVVYDRSAKATVEATGSLLAAFDAKGECRGVTEIEEGPLGMIFQLSIGVESATEKGFTLKVWNAETGEIQEIGGTIDCNADKQIGEVFAPVTYQVGALMQTIELDSGWTWMSFAVLPEDSTVGSVLAGGAFANGDKLKAPDKAVTYYNGSWYPATYELKPGVAYMVSKGTEGVDAFELTGSQAEDGVEVSAGWNWIGSLVLTNETIAALTHSVGFANGDQVKSGSASTTWYNGKWYPATFEIRSGAGYKAKFANAGKLYFGSASPSMPKMKLSAPAKLKAPNSAGKPTWKPVIQEDTFVAYLVISNDATKAFIESAGCTLAAFSAEGECRGVTEIEEGPLGKLYQLSVGVASATESGFTLKLWDETAKKVLDVDATLACNAEKQIGEIFEPVVLMVKTEPEQGTPFPDLGEKPSAADVQEAVKDSVDPQVIANINETNYNDFRTWAGTVKTKGGEVVGAQGVMDSPHAWLSYALDSAILIQTEPVEGDLRVDAFKPTATAGLFDFTVSVEDIPVGEGAKPGNLARVFGVEGGSSLSDMSANSVDILFGMPENGKVKFSAGPKDKTEPTFFMKVEMKP